MQHFSLLALSDNELDTKQNEDFVVLGSLHSYLFFVFFSSSS